MSIVVGIATTLSKRRKIESLLAVIGPTLTDRAGSARLNRATAERAGALREAQSCGSAQRVSKSVLEEPSAIVCAATGAGRCAAMIAVGGLDGSRLPT